MLPLRRVLCFCAVLGFGGAGLAATELESIISRSAKAVAEEEQNTQWQEVEVRLPEPPKQENLQPFYVSAATANKFFVDLASLSVGSDGVVRYTLLVLAPQGGRNVSYEGMRCDTKERRIYASGRSDGSWSKSRVNQWSRVQDAAANRQYATLYLEYFCQGGAIVRNADEARKALRRGGYPEAGHW